MRSSGVFLLINITEVVLWRVYEEVPHDDGDNKHFLRSAEGSESFDDLQMAFQNVTSKYCRLE